MRISCIQFDMYLNRPNENLARVDALVRATVERERPDTVVLPETWNLGFLPGQTIRALADEDAKATTAHFSALARELNVNIVAGSIVNRRQDGQYNTALVFDRSGSTVASYDKTHLFSPMGEDKHFQKGGHAARFTLDGMQCAVIICYDVRFPEWVRTLALPGLDILFVVSQWPDVRIPHLSVLTRARAIENQMFVALCNSCGTARSTVYGGNSAIIDPLGEVLAEAGADETVITADCDGAVLENIRSSIPVFRDRRPALYQTDR